MGVDGWRGRGPTRSGVSQRVEERAVRAWRRRAAGDGGKGPFPSRRRIDRDAVLGLRVGRGGLGLGRKGLKSLTRPLGGCKASRPCRLAPPGHPPTQTQKAPADSTRAIDPAPHAAAAAVCAAAADPERLVLIEWLWKAIACATAGLCPAAAPANAPKPSKSQSPTTKKKQKTHKPRRIPGDESGASRPKMARGPCSAGVGWGGARARD